MWKCDKPHLHFDEKSEAVVKFLTWAVFLIM